MAQIVDSVRGPCATEIKSYPNGKKRDRDEQTAGGRPEPPEGLPIKDTAPPHYARIDCLLPILERPPADRVSLTEKVPANRQT